ncbi:leukocyte surface antigen CD53-like [Neocloeon triangulifer]|uniref:leukocyte surface antigen CD53-like n=1 Tax=Neocloeon triangulifer TaxID=2078957 RepID=UPI00286EFB4E|nr:leukocyte surface antigen CD53-like [Neocloeon triangulifer]
MGAASIIKYMLFFFNLLICTGGLVLLGLGVLLNVELTGQQEGPWTGLSIIFISIGAIVFVIAFLGCCGAIRESTCMLTTFGVFLMIIFLIQVSGAILLFVYEDKLTSGFRKLLETTQGSYYDDGEKGKFAKETWDTIQAKLKCCGIDGPNDWLSFGSAANAIGDVLRNPAGSLGKVHVAPASCKCVDPSTSTCSNTPPFDNVYSQGCYLKLVHSVQTSSTIIAAVAIGLALVELIGAIFSFRLASVVRKRELGF